MSITWETAYACPATGTTSRADAQYLSAGTTYDSWEAGDYIDFISFSVSGDTIDSGNCKAVINSVEYACYLYPVGGGIWLLRFRYTENPTWSGGVPGTTLSLQAKVVTDLNTYYSGTGDNYICGPTTTPGPADDATAVNIETTELTFVSTGYDDTDATPFIGYLWKGAVLKKSGNIATIGTWDISSVTLDASSEYTWRIDTDTDGSTIPGPTWSFTTGAGFADVTATITAAGTLSGTASGGLEVYDCAGTISGSGTLTADPLLFKPPVASGLNNMASLHRLVALAKNRLYYEDL